MKIRPRLAFVLVAATSACTSTSDSPLAPDIGGASYELEGVKPPPPLGREDTYIDINVMVAEGTETPADVFTSADLVGDNVFNTQVFGRVFANSQDTNEWISFESGPGVTATVNAHLAYHAVENKTNGQGILIDGDGTMLDLSLVTIQPGAYVGACPAASTGYALCGVITFTYNNNGALGGTIRVHNSPPPPILTIGSVGN